LAPSAAELHKIAEILRSHVGRANGACIDSRSRRHSSRDCSDQNRGVLAMTIVPRPPIAFANIVAPLCVSGLFIAAMSLLRDPI